MHLVYNPSKLIVKMHVFRTAECIQIKMHSRSKYELFFKLNMTSLSFTEQRILHSSDM